MFVQVPRKAEVNPEVDGMSSLTFAINHQTQEVPAKMVDFLDRMGWATTNNHPESGEWLFHKYPPNGCTDEVRKQWDNELQSGYWFWYEAVAYEFTKFMTIGEDST